MKVHELPAVRDDHVLVDPHDREREMSALSMVEKIVESLPKDLERLERVVGTLEPGSGDRGTKQRDYRFMLLLGLITAMGIAHEIGNTRYEEAQSDQRKAIIRLGDILIEQDPNRQSEIRSVQRDLE